MTHRLTQYLALTPAVAILSIMPLAVAQTPAPETSTDTPAVPEVPSSPNQDVIVVRPGAQGFSVSGSGGARVGGRQPVKNVKAAYLGVGVSAAPQVLTEQLKLPQGVGLIVEFVEKDSPAEKAGLEARDLLQKLDEQLLINAQQFATLVRTFKPGARVTLTVIRKGDPITLDATLIEKEMPELSSTMHTFEFNDQTQWTTAFAPGTPDPARLENRRELEMEQAKDARRSQTRIFRVMPGSTSKIIKVEDGLRIEIESRDGEKSLLIQDDGGKKLFEGPCNTPEDMEKVPAEYREKVKATEQGVELKEVPATSPSQPKADADTLRPLGPTT